MKSDPRTIAEMAAGVDPPPMPARPVAPEQRPPREPPPDDLTHLLDDPPPEFYDDEPGFTEPAIRRLSDVQRERVSWVWDGRLPAGKFSIADGQPGVGKSTVTLDISARLTLGEPLPGCTEPSFDGPVDVVIINVEDGAGDTIRPRAEAAGADLERIHLFDGVRRVISDQVIPPMFPEQVEELESVIVGTGSVLAIADPLVAVLGTDAMKDQTARQGIAPIAAMADRTGAAIVGIRHLTKAAGASALYRGGGSVGLIGAARSGLLVAPHPDDDGSMVLAQTKSNLGPLAPSLSYRIESSTLGCGVIQWTGETNLTADELVAQPTGPEEQGRLDEAMAFLVAELAEGPVKQTRIMSQARSHGIFESTIRRAKKALNARSYRLGGNHPAWWWTLETDQGDQHDHP